MLKTLKKIEYARLTAKAIINAKLVNETRFVVLSKTTKVISPPKIARRVALVCAIVLNIWRLDVGSISAMSVSSPN